MHEYFFPQILYRISGLDWWDSPASRGIACRPSMDWRDACPTKTLNTTPS